MKTALIYPPYSAANFPHLALPVLTAWLRRAGREVVQADANLWLHRWLLTPAALERRLADLRQHRSTPSAAAWSRIIPRLAERIEGSLEALQRRETWRLHRENGRAGHAPHAGLLRIAESLLLHQLPLDRWTTLSAVDLVAEVRRGNPLLDRFTDEIFTPWLRRTAPDMVGFTLPYRQQLGPALLLAAAVRQERPGAAIVLGGHLVTQQLDDPSRLAGLFDLVDFAVVHDGEIALEGLCDALQRGSDPDSVGNLLWRDRKGAVRRSSSPAGPAPARLPAPDFHGLELGRYINGAILYPLETSRGCYWNRCTYCSYHHGEQGAWRPLPLDLVAGRIDDLVHGQGAETVMVVDEAVPPSRARKLARVFRGLESRPAWYFMGRLEPGFDAETCRELADAGCYGIFFGLESGCEEVLERMGKGIDLGTARHVLDHVAGAGLTAHLSLIGGFPGETREQAVRTRDLAAELLRGVPGFSANAHTFHLNRNSVVFDNPEHFGIVGGRGDDGETLAIHFEAQPPPGSTAPAPAELAGLINAGLRPLTHPRIMAQEEGVVYFLNHGRDEFLRRWALAGENRVPAGDAHRFRATGEVLLGRDGDNPSGGVTLCHLVHGALVGAPAPAGRVLALYERGDVLGVEEAWARLGRPDDLPLPALRGILGKLCEFGALETVPVTG